MIKHAFAMLLSAWIVKENERKGRRVESDGPGSEGLYLARSKPSVHVCRTKGETGGTERGACGHRPAPRLVSQENPRGRTTLACLHLGETVAAVALNTCRSTNPLLWCQKVSAFTTQKLAKPRLLQVEAAQHHLP